MSDITPESGPGEKAVATVIVGDHDLPIEKQRDADIGLGYFLEGQGHEVSAEEQKRVLRKIDLHVLPLMMVTAFLQYLDKTAITYSVLYGVETDLHMTSSQFSWASSLFFFGILVWQYPSLVLLQRYDLSLYFSTQVLLWGVLSFFGAVCSNFGGFGTVRFFLGTAESIQLPAFTIITTMWYKREEQQLRYLIWYGMNAVAIIAGGLFAYGVGHFTSPVALWKFPSIICGALTTTWAIALFFLLPSNPASARFLTPEERIIAIKRVQSNQTGIESKTFKPAQALEALLDPKVILYALGAGAGNVLSGISVFGGLVIKSFGFTTLQTTLLQCPTGLVEIGALIVFTTASIYIPHSRLALGALASSTALAGTVMLYALPLENKWGLVTGLWIMAGFIPSGFILGLGTVSGNIAGHTKKITAQGLIFVFYAVGSIIGPQLYTKSPYLEGRRANVVAIVVAVASSFLNIAYMVWENHKRRRYLAANPQLREEDFSFRDLTDKQNPFCFNAL